MNNFKPISSVLTETLEIVQEYFFNDNILGCTTGYTDFDRLTAGLHKGDLTVIAGRPSMGSSTLALNIAEWVGMHGNKSVIIFSTEMPALQICFRMICSIGRIEMQKIRSGQICDEDWPKLSLAVAQMSGKKIFINDDRDLTVEKMNEILQKIQDVHGEIGLIVLDGLHSLVKQAKDIDRAAELAYATNNLKIIAQRCDAPVIATCQLSRSLEQRTDRRPILSDLLGAAAIEHNADSVVFIYRDEVYNPNSPAKDTAEIIISKQRNGPTGMLRLTFLGHYSRFQNYANKNSNIPMHEMY